MNRVHRNVLFGIVPVVLVVAAAAVILWFGGLSLVGEEPTKAQEARTHVLVGAGDITACHYNTDSATARLLGDIKGTIFTLGDNAYPEGTRDQFSNCYGPTWGRYKARTKPSIGNHEYQTSGASAYFDYFGKVVGQRGKGYYSYDRGAWHIVVLNSNCQYIDCDAHSEQLRWLRADLKESSSNCTLAYFHHPLFSSGQHGNQLQVKPFWTALYNDKADIVLSGHDHDYERFSRQTPTGERSRQGIRQFVVGTGGVALRKFADVKANSEIRNKRAHGVLKLTLRPDSYAWKYIPVAGETFTDSGSNRCH